MNGWAGARIAVLGGAGFLGSHLCERLLDAGAAQVVAVDNLSTGDVGNLESLDGRPGFRLLLHDVTAAIPLAGPLEGVFNLASPASPKDLARLPVETMRAGALGTENGLRLARATGATFVQASAAEVYGDPRVHPQREDYAGSVDPTGPHAVYDEAKRYGEAIVCAYRRSLGVRARIARIFNTYGPRMGAEDGRVIPTLIGQALRGEDFTVFGDGRQTRAFCHVQDMVDGLLRLARSEVEAPVNLGNPEELTILDLVEAVRAAVGRGGRIRHLPLPPGDAKVRRPDIARARALLGWTPRVTLAEGLRETVAWTAAHVRPPAATRVDPRASAAPEQRRSANGP